MGSDRYCLRWNNHQNNLLGVFSQLLQEESLVDVTLACSEGHSIRAHKVVLSACSSYFQSLFLDHPNRHPIIILKDVCFAELRTLVEFMYRGEVNLDYCQLPTFLKTAKSLQVKGLTEMTHLHKTLSPDSDHDAGLHSDDGQPPSQITHLHETLSPGKLARSDDGQPPQKTRRRSSSPERKHRADGHALADEQPPSTVIATAGPTTTAVSSAAHEPLPLIRRRSRSPSDGDSCEKTSIGDSVPQTTHQLSPPRTSACSATASSPSRSASTVGFELSQPHSPSSRLPMSVSPPHPADSSSVCDDQRSITPDPDDDGSSIHSGPSDMTIGSQIPSPQCLRAVPGPSNFIPQQEPLSLLKKEPNDTANLSRNEDRSTGGNSGSDFSINRLSDSDRERDFERQSIYTCTYCGAAFPHQSKLTRHILSHSLETLKYREQSQPHLQYAPHAGAIVASSALALQSTAAAGVVGGGVLLLDNNATAAVAEEWNTLRTPLMELAHDSQSDAAESPGAVCKFCGKAFPDVSSLIVHLPAHTGDRPFKCEYCGKAFKLRHHMKDHCRVHTGERPFRCSLCGKNFSRSTILKAHEKTHYPKYVRKFLSSPSPEEEHRPPDLTLPCDLSMSENNVEASTSAPPMFMHRPTPSPSP